MMYMVPFLATRIRAGGNARIKGAVSHAQLKTVLGASFIRPCAHIDLDLWIYHFLKGGAAV
jgi:hypothetical protein